MKVRCLWQSTEPWQIEQRVTGAVARSHSKCKIHAAVISPNNRPTVQIIKYCLIIEFYLVSESTG